MKVVVILSAIVLLILAVNYFRKSESKTKPQSDANMIISDENSRKAQPSQVPPEMATWIRKTFGEGSETIVEKMKRTGKIYVPAVGMKDSFLNSEAPGKTLNVSDLNEGFHMALVTTPDGREIAQAASYSDIEILNDKEFIRERDAHEWLLEVLLMEESDGVVLNPKTRFMKEEFSGFYTTTNKFGVAELIGMLKINEIPSGVPYHELCNKAFEKGEYYKVLYYWSNSFKNGRPGDDWKLCEISKLKTYYALTFPGSKARSVSELDWMMQNHPSPEISEYAKTAPRV